MMSFDKSPSQALANLLRPFIQNRFCLDSTWSDLKRIWIFTKKTFAKIYEDCSCLFGRVRPDFPTQTLKFVKDHKFPCLPPGPIETLSLRACSGARCRSVSCHFWIRDLMRNKYIKAPAPSTVRSIFKPEETAEQSNHAIICSSCPRNNL